jgi:hypothetical protein
MTEMSEIMNVYWKRSDDGFCDSKCGIYKIVPKFWGCLNPTSYELWTNGKLSATRTTQKECKEFVINPPIVILPDPNVNIDDLL